MLKTSTETRHTLNGPTMGTRWSALFFAPDGFDRSAVQAALQAAVDQVDAQMSTWKPDSDLMRLNAAPVGNWVEIPPQLMQVLQLALEVGVASGGSFDIGMGDAILAWGFAGETADPDRIRAALQAERRPAHEALTFDPAGRRVCKTAPLTLDLNGIAKGYGVDRLAEVLRAQGIAAGLVGIDGEMRAMGTRPDGRLWSIAVESPDPDRRAAESVLALEDAAVATSGDYRQRVSVGGQYLSHTMDPRRGAPLDASPASVTVVARSCAEADAWATALMVLGARDGAAMARQRDVDALFLLRTTSGIEQIAVGPLFGPPPQTPRSSLWSSEGLRR
ncbi:thiamine biosynthesis protein ApbE [Methyloceanibacter methanicus]|uniref:FAD:protein FMN transferase n=1 Tax=Methyloceanibacter methanicus TaxID=1774968 RepID=A0A1E3W578_9HYPH|nr:FAD:protein FMN transferase [Methyloceanibacter methanicus]ODS00287.1 thiamine biosynthesis protein ApbE [Methyloceanibacter methanicus]